MSRAPLSSALPAAWLGLLLAAAPVRAQTAAGPGSTISEAPLPGGLRAALAAVDDRSTPDSALFLYEFIRRTHDAPLSELDTPRQARVLTLVAHLDRAQDGVMGLTAPDTVPLPLGPRIWTDVIFGGRAKPETLVRSIVSSSSAGFLYCGLLDLDDETRVWLRDQPNLLTEILERYAGPFAVAAPALRIVHGRVAVPGGAPAEPVWSALAGRPPNDAAAFVRAVVSQREGRLAYMLAAASHLTEAQLSFALRLTSPESDRIDAGRRMFTMFERISVGWNQQARPFWRPMLDPFLLVSELTTTSAGVPVVPGTKAFWSAALADSEEAPGDNDAAALLTGQPVDFVWLAEQVFKGSLVVRRPPYQAVLFASRLLTASPAARPRDALDAVRASVGYPALVATLERAHVTDPAVIAAAARRAAQLSRIDDAARAVRAIAQFQGLLFILTHAAARGGVPSESLPALVSSLAAVEPTPRGDYEGRLARWLGALLDERVRAGILNPEALESSPNPFDDRAGAGDRLLMRMLAGTPEARPRLTEWEGTEYRLDFTSAEESRLARLLGADARPHVAAAVGVAEEAERLAGADAGRDRAPAPAVRLQQIAQALRSEPRDGDGTDAGVADERGRRAAEALDRTAARLTAHNGRPGADAATLGLLADDMLAFGVMQLAYAVSMGHPDRVAITASEAAARHEFAIDALGVARRGPWITPQAGAERSQDWHVKGSLLGLDLRLAELSLQRVTMRLPPRRPSVAGEDRRTFVETAVLLDPRRLSDTDRDAIVAALARGRARAAQLQTAEDVSAAANAIGLSTRRANLLAWTLAHAPDRAAAFLDPVELLRLGWRGTAPPSTALAAWGVSADARTGCACLQFTDNRDMFAGRWTSGMLATAFPDLNLRLTELLAELRMPAALLGPVLSAATLEFINGAEMRDPDDRRGLSAFVSALTLEQVEQYLALLTTDGPLVPVLESGSVAAGAVAAGLQARRPAGSTDPTLQLRPAGSKDSAPQPREQAGSRDPALQTREEARR